MLGDSLYDTTENHVMAVLVHSYLSQFRTLVLEWWVCTAGDS